MKFQSTRPIRGATNTSSNMTTWTTEFQSTRPIRGATTWTASGNPTAPISIHAPHTGRDGREGEHYGYHREFQSTRPIRGATAKMHNLCSAFLQ